MGVHDALWPAFLNEVRQLAPHALIPWLVKSVKESDCKRSRPHDVEHVSAIHKEPVPLRDLPKNVRVRLRLEIAVQTIVAKETLSMVKLAVRLKSGRLRSSITASFLTA